MRRVILGAAVVALAACGSGLSTHAQRAAASPACSYRDNGTLPDTKCTPGVVNHAVVQTTIAKTICKPGWSTSVRPPVSVTEPQKRVALRQYGYAFGTKLSNYEYDHLIPLELGGAVDDLRNLWPEPHHVPNGRGSFAKDKVENSLRRAVCAGRIKLAAARRAIRTDWTKVSVNP